MAIVLVPGLVAQQGFRLRCQETEWNRRIWGNGQRAVNQGTDISNRTTWYLANGAPVIANITNMANPPVVQMHFNNAGNIDVNFSNNEACAVGANLMPNGAPDDRAITLTFTNPVKGVGAFVSFVSNNKALYNNRPITAKMFVKADGNAGWNVAPLVSAANTGFHVGAGIDPSAPFVAAERTGNELIKAIAFDADVDNGSSFDSLVISRLYWIP